MDSPYPDDSDWEADIVKLEQRATAEWSTR
jgi:hypothetical protein